MTSPQVDEPVGGDTAFPRYCAPQVPRSSPPAGASAILASGHPCHGSSFRENGSFHAAIEPPSPANGSVFCVTSRPADAPSVCTASPAYGSSFRAANRSPFSSSTSSFRATGSSPPSHGSSFRATASSLPIAEPSFCAYGSESSAQESASLTSNQYGFSEDKPQLTGFPTASRSSLPANGNILLVDESANFTSGSAFPVIGSAYDQSYFVYFPDNLSNGSTRSLEGLPLLISGSNVQANSSHSPAQLSSFREQGVDIPFKEASCTAIGPYLPSPKNSFPAQEAALAVSRFHSTASSCASDAYEAHDAACFMTALNSSSASQSSERGLCQFVFGDLENMNLGEEKALHIDLGVTLAWRNLWVTIPDRTTTTGVRPLLQNLTGFAEPGHIMAIMGPSGSGKSTLLDTLAGRVSNSTKQTGEIRVNGRKQILTFGNSAYVTQDDVLMASLTVWEAVFYSAQLQLPKQMSIEEKRERAEMTIKDMGLQGAANTRIGGWRARGLSGGEKRRVSIAIELLTRPRLLFLDEPTSGLDSAAAFNVVKRLRHLAVEGRTIVVSIHQPSGDVFELFDYLYLLSSGRTVYFGSISRTREFFSVNGFPCPPLQNPSDHYLRKINTDYEEDVENQGSGVQAKTKQVINLLVEAYTNSDMASEMTNRAIYLLNKEGELLQTTSDHMAFYTHVYILTKRSFVNMYRDIGYYWLRLVMYITLSICIGTVFYNVGYSFSAIQARAALLMFVSGLLTFMAIGGFPAFIEDLKVFDRERLNGHYGVAPFFIANTLSSFPFLLVISLVPGGIAYFLAGLHPGFDRFVFFVLALFVSVFVVESLMMMVASVVSDYLLGIIVGSGIQGLFLLTGGFFRLPHEIPKPVWRYPVSYMAFHTFSIQAFYKNDFEGLTFENSIAGQPPLVGDSILTNSFEVMRFSKWIDLLVLVGMAAAYRLLFFALIKAKERLHPMLRSFLSRR